MTDAPDKNFIPKPTQQVIPFEFRRNQIIDLINALKLIVRDYDDPQKPGRFVVGRIMANDRFVIDIGIDRLKDESHPLQKSLLKEFMKAKETEKNGQNMQKMQDGSNNQKL